nr:hypothetical protein Itr_chr02CG24400 [Ipomoea trifida]
MNRDQMAKHWNAQYVITGRAGTLLAPSASINHSSHPLKTCLKDHALNSPHTPTFIQQTSPTILITSPMWDT